MIRFYQNRRNYPGVISLNYLVSDSIQLTLDAQPWSPHFFFVTQRLTQLVYSRKNSSLGKPRIESISFLFEQLRSSFASIPSNLLTLWKLFPPILRYVYVPNLYQKFFLVQKHHQNFHLLRSSKCSTCLQ